MTDPRGDRQPKLAPAEVARLVVAGIVLVLLALFVLDNTDDVRVGYVFGDADVPMIVVLLLTALAGAVIGNFAAWRSRRRR